MNRKHTAEYKQQVVEYLINNRLAYKEAGRKYDLHDKVVAKWERIYLEEGPEGLYIERRVRSRLAGLLN